MRVAYLGAAALLAMTVAGAMPALADVKAGVDAWSRGDYDKAVAEWRGPAIAGDADAQFNMGQAYKLGRGVATDQAQAIEWFRKAAAQGHAQAEDNYALMLFQEGRKADAVPWLEKSVARDEKRTELVLGTMLFNGDAVKKDWVRAYALVSRSSRQGLTQASQTLAQMDQYISAEQRQKGTELASKIESEGHTRRLAAATNPSRTAPLELPAASPTKAMAKAPPGASYSPPARAPEKVAHAVVKETKPKPKEPVAAAGGNWRIQLGAFRDEANARALWGKVGGKTGGRVAYAKAGEVTRLQATGFASHAAAQAACSKAGVPCVVVAQ
ncbi:SPOR domain-containing protein [Sphingomonas sp. MMSM20]|uniref:SPOR domain-containing protein n=1 Tax=Sphingomonas lycopersici TaxID=2951807 RepID=UPI002237BE77|nr:SPOR domain-containing protein [Sphingomonas lycopersici]MCW6529287.1 SPOR domain-containing protein [Sphingomonas lycopersici]